MKNISSMFQHSMKDKNVLYFVFALAVVHLFGYLFTYNFHAIIVLLLTGFISSYFTRNMIIVLMVSIIVTNLVAGSKYVVEKMSNKEGLENKKENFNEGLQEGASNKETKKEQPKKQGMTTLSPASVEDDDELNNKKPKVDYGGTLEAAYDNIDKLLSSDAIKNMSNDTQRLAEKQKLLMGNIKKLEPMIQNANAMLSSLDMQGMQGMINSITKSMGLIKE